MNLKEWTPLCYGLICTLYFYNKMLLKSYEEDLKEFNFHQRAKTIFGKFSRHSIKKMKNLTQPRGEGEEEGGGGEGEGVSKEIFGTVRLPVWRHVSRQ